MIDILPNNHFTRAIIFDGHSFINSYPNHKQLAKQNEQSILDFVWNLQQAVNECTDEETSNKILSKYGFRYEKGDDN